MGERVSRVKTGSTIADWYLKYPLGINNVVGQCEFQLDRNSDGAKNAELWASDKSPQSF